MGVGWGQRTGPHPLLVGKTPKELEEMSTVDLAAHLARAKQYVAKLEDETLIRIILDLGRRQPHTLEEFPSQATVHYQKMWHVARKRAGLDAR